MIRTGSSAALRDSPNRDDPMFLLDPAQCAEQGVMLGGLTQIVEQAHRMCLLPIRTGHCLISPRVMDDSRNWVKEFRLT